VIESEDPAQQEIWVNYNGGAWWLDLDRGTQEDFIRACLGLPLAMEVETSEGLVGIVHADVPPLSTWEQFLARLEEEEEEALFYALWSRIRIQYGHMNFPVAGRVDRIYCGHTPTCGSVLLDNVYYIDTGAVYGLDGYHEAKLTLVEFYPPRHREYSIATSPSSVHCYE
jgi:serine/threonine protein phosphatase 1